MAQLCVEPGFELAKAWVVVVDLETMHAEVTLMLVVHPDREADADAAVRLSADGTDLAALRAQLLEGLSSCGIELFLSDLDVVLPPPSGSVGGGDSVPAVATPGS